MILVKNYKIANQKQIYQGKNEMSTNQGPGGSRNVFFFFLFKVAEHSFGSL